MKKIMYSLCFYLLMINNVQAGFIDNLKDVFSKNKTQKIVTEEDIKNLDDTNLLQQYAEDGNVFAEVKLGMINYSAENYKEAFKWLKKAADQGDARGQAMMGVFYYDGIGVDKNSEEAFKWYKLSAEQGFVESQVKLGAFYATGEGVSKDEKEAFKWLAKAAEQQHSDAQRMVGYMYAKGMGVSQDYVKAYKWLRLSILQGNVEALFFLNSIEQDIPIEQAKEGMKLAEEWRASHN